MKLPLTLTFRASAEESTTSPEVTAVLIFGTSPSEWLSALCAAQVPTNELMFLPLSHIGNADLVGAIVAGDAVRDHLGSIHELTRTLPEVIRLPPLSYRCLAGRLYIPLEADLVPQVTNEELRALLPAAQEHRLVWHPSAGLIEFEADQILSTADLVFGPLPLDRRWDRSTYGEQLNDRIRSLNPVATLEELDSIIEQGRDDIGEIADDIRNAPRAPDEIPHTTLNDAIQWMKRQAARTIFNITNRLPSRPTGSQFLGKLHQWAANMLTSAAGAAGLAGAAAAAMSSGLSTQRENELKRLLHMLENDPDLGLKYALPLHGNSSRGTAPPSGRLGERIPDFDLNQLGRSGRADAWDVPWQYQAKLTQKYRELAQREIRLGNHRRAAYIYATLLHDLHSAAATLEAGQLYRDAAAIYQIHLQQLLKAAACLKNGGMWEEAVVIYRDYRQWMTAGELYGLLNQPESAAEVYELELKDRIQTGEYLEAATLAVELLHDRERGFKLLRDGWDAQRRGADCLRRLFQEFSDTGQHQRTEDSLKDVISRLLAIQMPEAVTICSEVATTYPTASVRDFARRQTWQLASSLLARESESHSRTALQAMSNLAKEDELLARDTSRFAMLQRAEAKQKAEAKSIRRPGFMAGATSGVKALQVYPRVLLQSEDKPKTVRWTTAVASSAYLFCLGETPERRVVVGRWPLLSLAPSAIPKGSCVTIPGLMLLATEPCTAQLRIKADYPDRVNLQLLPEMESSNQASVRHIVRANSFVDSVNVSCYWILDVQFSSHWYALIMTEDASPQLLLSGGAGVPMCSFPLSMPQTAHQDLINFPSRVHLCDSHVLIVAGRAVYRAALPAERRFGTNSASPLACECVLEMDSEWTGFVPSQIHTVPRVLVATESSCYAVWVTTGDSCRVASELQSPIVGCTRHGAFVVATSNEISCYHVNQKKSERLVTIESLSGQNVAIVTDTSPHDFLVVQADGTIQRFTIPGI